MAEPAILSYEETASPDDFRMQLVALVSLAALDDTAEALLARHGGQVLAVGGDGVLAVFRRMDAAAFFARALQAATKAAGGPRPAIGINLGTPAAPADIAFAHALRRRARPGETLISAISENRLTSRVRAEGPNEPVGWRVYVLPAAGLTFFLGYFLFWCYAIFWRISAVTESGRAPCWPDWLCR
jgi:hypothetical protein